MSTISVANSMLHRGYFLNTAVFPAVSRNRGGVRFTVTRYHSPDQIRAMLNDLNQVTRTHEGPDEFIDLTAFEDG